MWMPSKFPIVSTARRGGRPSAALPGTTLTG
jgi:hypothetical protein